MSRFLERGSESIGQLDEDAKRGPSLFPRHIEEAMAHAGATIGVHLRDDDSHHQAFLFLIAMMKNLYRAGYAAGVNDTRAVLHANEG